MPLRYVSVEELLAQLDAVLDRLRPLVQTNADLNPPSAGSTVQALKRY